MFELSENPENARGNSQSSQFLVSTYKLRDVSKS